MNGQDLLVRDPEKPYQLYIRLVSKAVCPDSEAKELHNAELHDYSYSNRVLYTAVPLLSPCCNLFYAYSTPSPES